MTRDEILRLAIKCQLVTTGNRDGVYMDALMEFASLVQAAEREACELTVDGLIESNPVSEVQQRYNYAYMEARDAIRARGEE